MKTPTDTSMTLTDATGRRRFLRTGGLLLAAAPVLASRPVLADDCDRAGPATREQKLQAGAGSDSDVGAGSDPVGCGREEPPKISQGPDGDAVPPRVVTVVG